MKSLPRTKTAADLRQVSVTTHPGAEESVTALVGRVSGQTPSVYADMATGLTTVSAYLPLPDAKVATTRAALRAGLAGLEDAGIDAAPGRIAIRRVKPLDWSESWKRHFRPIEIGAVLLVRPTWSRRKPKAGQQVVLLDPGLSFGTGQHATTHFCLTQVAALRGRDSAPAPSLIDMGTGSGILAIAAAKLGYAPVRAFDFDADCVRITRENAELNGVAAQVKPVLADVTRLPRTSKEQHDVVCANLMSDLLLAERDRILARLKPGGSLVLAGILSTQFTAVEKAFRAAGLKLVIAKTDKEWRSGRFCRA